MSIFTKNTLLLLAPLAFVSCKSEPAETSQKDSPSQIETAGKPYPLDTCLVSGKKLGSMGDPYVINHEGQQIQFCCDGCEPSFKKNPAKYLAKLHAQ